LARAIIKGKNEDTSLNPAQERDVANVVKKANSATDSLANSFAPDKNPDGKFPISGSFEAAVPTVKRAIAEMRESVPPQFLKDMAGAVVDTMELAYLKSTVEHRVAAAVRANGPDNEGPMRAQLEKQIKEMSSTLQETHRDLAVQMKGMGWPSGMITDLAQSAIRSSAKGGSQESVLDNKRFRQEADKFYKEVTGDINA
jgi:hypothetical protein